MKNFWLCCIIIIICRLLAAYVFSTFDDAFITFRYAQNLVEGHGLIYNLHERVMGTTAPLFAIIASIPLFLSISAVKFFVVFNICCDLGSLYLIYRFFFERDKILLILFTTLFALDPTVSRISIGCMELNLFLFLSLLAIVLYLNQKKTFSFLLMAVIYFLRPEALILLLIISCYEFFVSRKIPWKYGLLSIIALAIPLFFIYEYYGQLLPQSVIAKSRDGRFPLGYLIQSIFFPHVINYFIFPLAVIGFIRRPKTKKYFLLAGLWIISYAGAYYIGGPFVWTWYIYAIEVVQLIFAAVAIREIAGLLHINLARYKFLIALPFAVIAIWIFVFFHFGRSGVEINVFDELKKDFQSSRVAEGKVFFASDIGALGFYTKGYIYDNLMLVTPQAMNYHSSYDRIIHVNPDYLFLYTGLEYGKLMKKDSTLFNKYSFVKRYSRFGKTTLPANINKEETKIYKQDYLLFKRKD